MTASLAKFAHLAHVDLVNHLLPQAAPQAPQAVEPSPGDPNFDFTQFHPDSGAVPHPGVFTSLGNGALWVAFACSFVAFACGILMWVLGPVFGSQYAASQGKTQMWKGLAGVLMAAGAVTLCVWAVDLVNNN